jgi:hypothetical protein
MWVNEVPRGEGVFCYKDGSEYRGEVLDGRRHGWGVLKLRGGDCYTGPFVNDKREGEGTLVVLPVSQQHQQ